MENSVTWNLGLFLRSWRLEGRMRIKPDDSKGKVGVWRITGVFEQPIRVGAEFLTAC